MSAPLPPLTPAQEAETNLPRIMGLTVTFHVLALGFVAVRLYTRFVIVKAPKLDDLFVILATIGAFTGFICIVLQAPHGLGRHRQVFTDADFRTLRLLNWVYSLVSVIIAFTLLKISIALSLLRLSRARWYIYTLYALIGFIVCYTIVALGSFLGYCQPVAFAWDPRISATCYSRELFVMFSILNNSCSMFSDVVCATLPVPIIWTLQMKLRTRIYLIAVLSLGYLTVGVGGIKAYFQIGARRSQDPFFDHHIQFFGFLQFNLGLIVACAPTLRPLLGRALKLSSHDKISGRYYADSNLRRSKPDASKRRTGVNGTEFELEERQEFGESRKITTTIQGKTTVYDGRSGIDSGSEEMILQGTDAKGILRTTEISIK